MNRTKHALLALVLAAACREDVRAPRDNRCQDDGDCVPTSTCDLALGICTLEKPMAAYPIVLTASRLKGGAKRLERFTFPATGFTQAKRDLNLDVPEGVLVRGRIRGGQDEALHTEVTFVPKRETGDASLPPSATVVQSLIRRASGEKIKEDEDNVAASLAPNRDYVVRIVPLGPGSKLFPPKATVLSTKGSAPPLDVSYEPLVEHRGALVDERLEPVTKALLRAMPPPQSIPPGEDQPVALSSTSEIDGGAFTLHLEQSVSMSKKYVVQVSLDPENPWQTVIEIDPNRIDTSNKNYTVVVPRVPEKVLFEGLIEAHDEIPIAAELLFESAFPLPSAAGDLRDRDWCNSSVTGDVRPKASCSARVRATSDASGVFSVPLLPGDYKLTILPAAENKVHTKPLVTTAVIETQPGGKKQQGQVFRLRRGPSFEGVLLDSAEMPMPNVVLRALALQAVGTLGEPAGYNRPAETVTRDDGSFALDVDVGYYDFVARAGDGYPWMYAVNGAIVQDARKTFKVHPPVLLSGVVQSAGEAAVGAAVDAYAIVDTFDGGTRPVFVGRALSDETGRYQLLMPPEITNLLSKEPENYPRTALTIRGSAPTRC